MKKAFWLTALITVLTLALAGGASAAQPKEITVWLEEEQLSFDVPPLLHNNVTYVEFRGLFTALDFEIAYDAAAKRITALSYDEETEIEMTIGSNRTLINGEPASGQVQPLVRDGRTLVPLRFVGEATGLNVAWDGVERTITMSAPVPDEAYLASLEAFLQKLGQAESSGDIAAVRALLDKRSPSYDTIDQTLTAHLANVKIVSVYEMFDIGDWSDTSVELLVDNLSTKVSGGFFLDHNSSLVLDLTRDGKDREWKIEEIWTFGKEYTNVDKLIGTEATVPADEKAKIIAVLEEQFAASNAEDMDRYMATIDPNVDGYASIKDFLELIFEEYDLNYELNDKKIIGYDGNVAHIYMVQTTTKIKGSDFTDNRLEAIVKISKQKDGKWLIGDTTVLDTEEI
ncbi:hypothetical protein PA598K_03775 [Paenibacillus sp. 598K]|uniref:copper amine oxidase N-terminal domain-containing protein n=1 Tax=Paenibacillus sp. 598K TaxID=1117987 RepID=UPI000FF9ADF0|nr:copper amine oxidase N-terminal domain-containing protein [Paenibacillus sp. 598K]GBF75372.1 hypothetical protein PA598K_03775 [Paenibacillus sp. 598K]